MASGLRSRVERRQVAYHLLVGMRELELRDNGVGFQYLELGERDSYRQPDRPKPAELRRLA